VPENREALIGHTGFVGGNLLRQGAFADLYNSKNIEEIAGKEYARIVCAGAPGVKWLANQRPQEDLAAIERLIACLGRVRVEQLVLISTIDVYPDVVGVDEETPIDESRAQPYGKHRRMLERFAEEEFGALIVRLPGLFGPGLKKNVIYDFLTKNRVETIHADAVFQFYDLDRLTEDVGTATRAGLRLVNFATEPVSVREVARRGFGADFDNAPNVPPPRYDFRTRYAARFGRKGFYLRTKDEVLDGIRRFVERSRGGPA
jgi:nucleoside-diphosphate-sugar epimerase